ncbi:MAG: nucleotidyltransferase family protein [Bacteroidetes bacterium]|nr:nucleotidyltransferase family protein [Bacteroidota bacterium]
MNNYKKHLIHESANIKEALNKLNMLGLDGILFVTDDGERLIGSLTDGDIRRGLLRGLGLDNVVVEFIQKDPKFFRRGNYNIHEVIDYRTRGFRIVPVIDADNRIINIVNFRIHRSCLPVDAIIMAGGRGERLRPLTDNVPKPLLIVGNKPIIEHNVDQLAGYGVSDLWISLRYLGEQIRDYFKDGESKGVSIQYVWEDAPLGTIGAAARVNENTHDYVLVMNSDILTNLNYEDFFLDFINKNADFSVVTIPYDVKVPYAVLEMSGDNVRSFKEKPTYTYYSNGGIYLMKKECLDMIPRDTFFNTTDLMETLIAEGKNVISYPLRGYWLDIGRHDDYRQAQADIEYIKF